MTDSEFVPAWETRRFRELLTLARPGEALALVRKQMGLSQAAFGDLLHWDRTHSGRVERGEVRTLFDIRELLRVTDALSIPRAALQPLLLGDRETGTIEEGDEGVDDMNRRQFGLATGAALICKGAAGPKIGAVPVKVGIPHLEHFEKTTRNLWEHDNRSGSGRIRSYGFEQYRFARRLLEHGHCGTRTRTQLVGITGWLSNTAAWLARDSGLTGLARRQLGESVLLAEEAGDSELLAAALGDLADLLLSVPGSARKTVRLTQRASELVRGTPSTRLNALRAAGEATAHASAGDAPEYRRAMTRAWREFDRGFDDGNDPAWLAHMTPTELRVHEAMGHKLLGHHHKAADLYRNTINQPGTLPRDEASYRVYYATSLAGLGDTTTALETAHTALDLLTGPVHSPRLLTELAPVHHTARTLHTDAAQDFRRRYAGLHA